MADFEFKPWPKIARAKNAGITVTEKIDGTNACVVIFDGVVVGCQSRNRKLSIDDDNMGFAVWVDKHSDDLAKLGGGYHYGEWAGPGIQKNPHNLDEKTFFIFNTFRPQDTLPDNVQQVPILYQGAHKQDEIERVYAELAENATDYTPEGIVVYFHASRSYAKMTFKNQDGKWRANE